MPTKPGNGGHGQEQYDPATGRYVGNDETNGLEKYHKGSGKTSADLEKELLNGEYGQDFADYYNALQDPAEKQAILDYIHSNYDEENTKGDMDQRFKTVDYNEFKQWQQECRNNTSSQDLDYLRRYTGTGKTSFQFNKALRMGLDEFYKTYPELENAKSPSGIPDWLSRGEIEKQAEAFDRMTSSFQAPRDCQVYRYTGTGPLISWFEKTGVLDGLKTEDTGFNTKRLASGSYTLDDLANRLSKLVGSVVPKDGAYSSFSTVSGNTHMGKKGNSSSKPEKPKDIMIKYNVPKGKNIYITGNSYESEGFFDRNTQFFIQDVKIENSDGKNRVVMYFGVK